MLPVYKLRDTFLNWFEEIEPEFIEELKDEIKYCGLKGHIKYMSGNQSIKTVAEITPEKEIVLHENFNQFLWCLLYSSIVIYKEGIEIPNLKGEYKGEIVVKNELITKATEVFYTGMSLFSEYDENKLSRLPDPNDSNDKYVGEANSIFCSSMTTLLLHEFAHQYFKHIEYDPISLGQAEKEEIDADDFAHNKMSKKYSSTPAGTAYKIGTLLCFCSLVFFDNSLKGGCTHPDPDKRVRSIIEKMDLHDDDPLWAYITLIFKLWSNYYHVEIDLTHKFTTNKDQFYLCLDKIREIKTFV